ncbi:MAG: protein kinase family protein [Bacteroidales bacterium]|nr:protein kinase family protein [Bacteroidales bacterium]
MEAIENVGNIQDAELYQCTYDEGPLGPLYYGGGFGLCFPLTTKNQKKYAFKVWFNEISDIQKRLIIISDYLKKVNLPYFVTFSFLEKGLNIPSPNPEIISALKMEWIDGISLKKYVCEVMEYSKSEDEKKQKMLNLVELLKKCFKQLHDNHISHGDLQHDNIMIVKDDTETISIKLVDYDCLYVPTLGHCNQNTKGYSAYQHPNRTNANIGQLASTEKDDYFSEKVIILSLYIFAYYPNVYQEIDITKNEQEFLFDNSDFNNITNSRVYRFIKKQNPITIPKEINDLFDEIIDDLQKPLTAIKSLHYLGGSKYDRPEQKDIIDSDILAEFLEEQAKEKNHHTYSKTIVQTSSKPYIPNPDKYNRQ